MTAGSELDKGFPLIAPPSTTVPHPFVTHDVGEEDWLRFLNDAKTASKLSPVDRVKSTVAPMAMQMSIGIGYLVSKAIMKRQKDKKATAVGQFIDNWNNGTLSHSGPDVPPPDMAHLQHQDHHYDTDSDSASDSDVNYSNNSPESSKVATRGGRRERRMERRAERGQRMGRRREKRSQAKEQWRLILVALPSIAAISYQLDSHLSLILSDATGTFGDEFTLEALAKSLRPSSALSAESQSEECGPCDTTYVRNQT
ncbi:predicted protein [Postia placenta Mad-698-R]|nr:predicted protein [Postia placenta Mad-698-R]